MEEEVKKNEKIIGRVTHFYNKIKVAVIELTESGVKTGETLRFQGGGRDFEQLVDSMQVEHEEISEAKKGDSVGMKVNEPVREGYVVYKVIE